MGCDIHMAVEVRGPDGWRLARNFYPCSFCDETGNWYGKECPNCGGSGRAGGYHQRSYNVFGMLADVRNGIGVAGSDTGDGWPPLAPRRGIPDDIGAELRAAIADETIWLGDHDQTWCTLAELEAYDWRHVTQERGVVDLDNYAAWRERPFEPPPESYGDVIGPNAVHVTPEQARVLLTARQTPEQRASTYTTAYWPLSAASAAGDFYAKFLPALRTLGAPDAVRLVFGFDG